MFEKKCCSLEPIEKFCFGIVSGVPIFRTWISMYFHSVETLEKEKRNANFGNIVKNLFVVSVIGAAVSSIAMILASFLNPQMAEAMKTGLAIIGIEKDFTEMLVFSAIVYILYIMLEYPILSALCFISAKLLGGKGKYTEQTFGLVLIIGGATLISIPFTILFTIPCIGFFFSLAALLVFIYALYSFYRLVKAMHELSSLRAAVAVVAPFVLVGIIYFVASLIFMLPKMEQMAQIAGAEGMPY